jgi:hypothetical protein
MSLVKVAYKNLFEISDVTLEDGTTKTGPLSRLWDRRIALMGQWDPGVDLQFELDQNQQTQSVNSLFIPPGHDLWTAGGIDIYLKRSNDGVSWFDPSGWSYITRYDNSLIAEEFDLSTFRYWQITATPLTGSDYDISEIFLSHVYEFSQRPSYEGAGPVNKFHNASNEELSAGGDSFTKHGKSKWRATYAWPHLAEADKDIMLGLLDGTGNVSGQGWLGKNPFYLKDVDGAWHYVKIVNDPRVIPIAPQTYEVTLDLLEVIN